MISDKAYRAMNRLKPWRRTVNIKDLLTNDDSPESAVAFSQAVAKRLQAAFPEPDIDLAIIIDDFQSLNLDDEEPLDRANDILDDLYDWADANRIWLGP